MINVKKNAQGNTPSHGKKNANTKNTAQQASAANNLPVKKRSV
jgi:hypothetical protein